VRIAYLFDRPLPAIETDSEQAINTLAALARRGHHVQLILPERRPPTSVGELKSYYQVKGDFEIISVPNPLRAWSTGRKWWHAWHATGLSLLREVDLIYTRNFPTLFLAARAQRPFVYETYRNWMDQFPVLRPAFRRVMSHPLFLGAMFHSHLAYRRYQALGIPSERLEVVHNGYSPERFETRIDKQEARRRLSLPLERPLVTYTGHINATKGLDVVLEAARRLPEVDFALVGASGRGLISTWARQLANVHVIPWQPFDKVVDYLFASDILIQPPSKVPLRWVGNTILPMKLFLYLAAARPIVAPDAPDVRELLTDDVNAVLLPVGEVGILAKAVRDLLSDPVRAERLAQAGWQIAQGLTWDARAEKIEAFLQRRLALFSPSNATATRSVSAASTPSAHD
jgi:glycosyltransferase involved in cell wall biosynthesis